MLDKANLAARRFELPAGASIYEPATPAKSVYLIHTGQVRVLLSTPGAKVRAVRLLEILGPGDWFGAPALSAWQTYQTQALAITPVTLSEVHANRLVAELPHQPIIAAALIRALADKLQASYSEAANLVFADTNQRLVKALLHFSRSAAATPRKSAEGEEGVELRITHQELAQAIGAARETVSLALTQLRQKKLLKTGRNRLSFNPGALESFAESQLPSDAQPVLPQATDGAAIDAAQAGDSNSAG